MIDGGKLEARIKLPAAWSATLNITGIGGPYTLSWTSGATYYPSDLLSDLATKLNAAAGGDGTFAVSVSTETGLVSITHTVQTFTLALPTDLRAILGFAADLTPAALTFTGTSALRGLWLPDCPQWGTYGAEQGHTEVDRSVSTTPAGVVHGLVYGTRKRYPAIRWTHVGRARARAAGEVTPGESFESWWLDTHGGRRSYFPGVPPVRVFASSSDASPFVTLQLTTPSSTEMSQAVEGWTGLFGPIEIGGYAQ